MMVDLEKLTKSDIVARAKWKCPLPGHSRHNGLEHPRCYDKLNKIKIDNTCILDIETEDLRADYGIVFCWSLYDVDENKIYSDVLTLDDIKKYSSSKRQVQPKEDRRVIEALVDRLSQYQRVVTHYGSRFDLSFIRTRAVICNIPFPEFGRIYQTDTWQILKHKFCLSRRTLQNACLKIVGKSRKDHLSLSIKHGCLRGEKWALDLSLKHCIQDVLDTRDLYNKIYKFAKKSNSSI